RWTVGSLMSNGCLRLNLAAGIGWSPGGSGLGAASRAQQYGAGDDVRTILGHPPSRLDSKRLRNLDVSSASQCETTVNLAEFIEVGVALPSMSKSATTRSSPCMPFTIPVSPLKIEPISLMRTLSPARQPPS